MSVLVVVAHADDEVLGAGGTIARHARAGEVVNILFLTNGVGARGDAADAAAVDRRMIAARNAARLLGARPPRSLNLPDNRLDGVELLDTVQAIETVVAEIKPDTVYTHHNGDLNIDHVLCQRAVLTACRPQPGSPVRRIFAMEVASSTEWNISDGVFAPTRFVDISDTLDIKRQALKAYAEEMRPFPHARSYEALEALARWRGATIGCVAAEAFMVLRDIVGP